MHKAKSTYVFLGRGRRSNSETSGLHCQYCSGQTRHPLLQVFAKSERRNIQAMDSCVSDADFCGPCCPVVSEVGIESMKLRGASLQHHGHGEQAQASSDRFPSQLSAFRQLKRCRSSDWYLSRAPIHMTAHNMNPQASPAASGWVSSFGVYLSVKRRRLGT